MAQTLPKVAASISDLSADELPAVEVVAITDDSRKVEAGSLFVAVRGSQYDGHEFIQEALERGAVAIVGGRSMELPVPYLQVADERRALAQLAAAWQGYPARQLVMIGVTGTDGKTTTTNLIHQILTASGHASGMITSVEARIGSDSFDTGFHVTTPPALELQEFLRRMVEADLTHCVVEATSHGLAQRRLAACEFDLAVVTNISHEHLDYHGSIGAYREAKAELLRALGRSAGKDGGAAKCAVLNRDDGSFEFLRANSPVPAITYGTVAGSDLRAERIESDAAGIRFRVVGPGYQQAVESRLLGDYNVFNCLAAFTATVQGLAVEPAVAAAGITSVEAISGRMERIDLGQEFTAIVDFAHTPNALRRALEAAHALSDGRVLSVFGSAGLRDRAKRRMMAAISVEIADFTILTAEDPRTEPLTEILNEMAAAAKEAGGVEGEDFLRVPDRGQALREAVTRAAPGDLVLACGKGHEQSMCFGTVEHPWDDRTALRAVLAEHLDQPGPRMPPLPTSLASGLET